MQPATERQQAILDFVQQYLTEHGFPPTLREIGGALGMANVSAVRGHVAALEKKGYLVKNPDKARSIRIVEPPSLLSRFKKKLHEFARTDEGVVHRLVYGVGLAVRVPRVQMTGQLKLQLMQALEHRAAEHGWKFARMRIEANHLRLWVQCWPNHSPEMIVARIRHACEVVIRHERKQLMKGRRLWVRGYVVTTEPEHLDALVEQFLQEEVPADTETEPLA